MAKIYYSFFRAGSGSVPARIGLCILLLFTLSAYPDTLRRVDLRIRTFVVSAEVAATPPARQQGLMYRKHLPADAGMVFVFPELDYHSMWMVNTYVPLSAAFIDDQGVILNIADMQPLTTNPHSAAKPARFVLEVNQGWFAARGIKAGDRVLGLPAAAASE